MAREESGALSTEEAKERLREASRDFGIAGWVKHRPLGTVALGALGGLLLANIHRPVRNVGRAVRTVTRFFP